VSIIDEDLNRRFRIDFDVIGGTDFDLPYSDSVVVRARNMIVAIEIFEYDFSLPDWKVIVTNKKEVSK
jgi:hypothetical protein